MLFFVTYILILPSLSPSTIFFVSTYLYNIIVGNVVLYRIPQNQKVYANFRLSDCALIQINFDQVHNPTYVH